MFSFINDKVKILKKNITTIEDRFYGKVMQEIESGYYEKGSKGRAISMSNGDKDKEQSLYIESRAFALQEQHYNEYREKEKALAEEKRRAEIIMVGFEKLYINGKINKYLENDLTNIGYQVISNYKYVKKNGIYYDTSIDCLNLTFSISERDSKKILHTFKINADEKMLEAMMYAYNSL